MCRIFFLLQYYHGICIGQLLLLLLLLLLLRQPCSWHLLFWNTKEIQREFSVVYKKCSRAFFCIVKRSRAFFCIVKCSRAFFCILLVHNLKQVTCPRLSGKRFSASIQVYTSCFLEQKRKFVYALECIQVCTDSPMPVKVPILVFFFKPTL